MATINAAQTRMDLRCGRIAAPVDGRGCCTKISMRTQRKLNWLWHWPSQSAIRPYSHLQFLPCSTIAENPPAQEPHVNWDQHHQEQPAKPRCAAEVSRDFTREDQRAQTFRQMMQRINCTAVDRNGMSGI